ncbi:MAG: OmpA family protein [Thiotrichaceae bacterium]|nr:OmpA family protein [Thiotrichaceae bacterium]PCI12575.1 MAG: hypothetical protein COB71_08705 [Thiotrichales bacterium]
MKTVKHACAFVLLGTMVSTATVAAEKSDNRWYLGVGMGISKLDPDVSGTIFSIEESRDSGYLLNLGYDLSERISIEGQYADLGEAIVSPNGNVGYQVWGLSGLYYVYDDEQDHRGLGAYLKAGLGVMKNESELKFERQNDGHVLLGAGLEYAFNNGFALRTELDLYDKDAQLLTVSLLKRFGGNKHKVTSLDDDHDGVFNNVDQCPATLAGFTVDTTGCEPDSDRDGVVDRIDQCSATPAGAAVDATGCEPDGDRDGVVDSQDRCLATPPSTSVDATGCEPDGDRDGVADSQDACLTTLRSVVVDATGCALDHDYDGILDSHDQCLDSAAGAVVDSTGCEMAAVVILKGVQFESGSAQLKDESKRALEGLAKTLKRYPQMVVEVAGYTDSLGSAHYNKQLSDRRAKSVVTHLIAMGVNADNMLAKGYGPVDPVADNATAAGRAENRRVELHTLKR